MVRAIPSHPHQPLDFTRIAANAGAIAFNGAMLMLMLIPLSAPRLLLPDPTTTIDVTIIRPDKKVDPPPPPPTQTVRITRDPVKPQPVAHTQVQDPPPIVVDSPPMAGDPPGIEQQVAIATPPPIETGPLIGATLQALKNPPPSYPPEAVRGNLTGVVELEILVGIDGKPIDVSIVRSSGHRILDQAAVRVVKSRWTFQPAMSNGQPVQARGRVPIEFKLDQ
jgi:protein TonB